MGQRELNNFFGAQPGGLLEKLNKDIKLNHNSKAVFHPPSVKKLASVSVTGIVIQALKNILSTYFEMQSTFT